MTRINADKAELRLLVRSKPAFLSDPRKSVSLSVLIRVQVEPIIGHRMGRNFLKEKDGDKINAILAGRRFNI
jgi:hypothetical protein